MHESRVTSLSTTRRVRCTTYVLMIQIRTYVRSARSRSSYVHVQYHHLSSRDGVSAYPTHHIVANRIESSPSEIMGISSAVSSPARILACLGLAWGVQHLINVQMRHGPVGLCSNEEPSDWIDIEGMASNHNNGRRNLLSGKIRARPCQTFSESYQEARAKFRFASSRLAEKAPAGVVKRHTLFVIPGKDYTIDITIIRAGPDAGRGLTIHSSGCHGVEGEYRISFMALRVTCTCVTAEQMYVM